jgi:GntR family transcriptional regulator of vanillate catabolism
MMTTRSQEATERLRAEILDRTIEGGARMNEADLAEMLGMSRTPVRVAINTLAAEGLLDYVPNAGYVVRRYSAQDVIQIYEVRGALEGLAAQRAAETGLGDAQRGAIDRVLASSEDLVNADLGDVGWVGRWRDLNNAFHQAVIDAAQSAYLSRMIEQARSIPFLAELRFRWFDRRRLLVSIDDHRRIFHAIGQGRGHEAEALARGHVLDAGHQLAEQWRNNRIDEPRRPRGRRSARAA